MSDTIKFHNEKEQTFRSIDLPRGGNLEVELNEEFLEVVKSSLGLPSSATPSDDDIRKFIHTAVENALNKSVKEQNS